MELNEMAIKLTEVEQRSKSNTHRLDMVEKNQEALSELTASVRVLATDQGNLKDDVGEIKTDVKSLMGRPAKHWDGLVDKLIFGLAGAFIAWILTGAPGM